MTVTIIGSVITTYFVVIETLITTKNRKCCKKLSFAPLEIKLSENIRDFNPFMHNVKKCEHRKIFEVCLAIFEHYAWQGLRVIWCLRDEGKKMYCPFSFEIMGILVSKFIWPFKMREMIQEVLFITNK